MIENSHMAESISFQHQVFTEPKENLRYLPPSDKEDHVSPKVPMQGYDMNHGHFRGRSESSSQPSKKSRSGPKGRSISPSKRFKAMLKGGSKPAEESQDTESFPSRHPRDIDADFLQILREMQVPGNIVRKLTSLDTRVKESMIRGRENLTLSSLTAVTTEAGSCGKHHAALPDFLRKSRSNLNLNSDVTEFHASSQIKADLFCRSPSRTPSGSSSGSFRSPSSRNNEFPQGLFSQGKNPSTSSLSHFRSVSGSFGREKNVSSKSGAVTLATMLKANDTSCLDINRIKKMRAVISSESPSWLTEFFQEGGYDAMLTRLNEILQMEWREEQRDDNMLHELLRCFVALASTECGREKLASSIPRPFDDLVELLFSEKRPGDLSTRKLLVDLLCILVGLPKVSTKQVSEQMKLAKQRHVRSSVTAYLEESSSYPHYFGLLVALLHNKRDPSKEALVDFISASHTPRPFKSLINEILNINRDYFWVFCHSSNRFWALQSININEVQGPKVPGGMTGGVEFEAMSYLTAHMRLINLLAYRLGRVSKLDGKPEVALEFHKLLFFSGLDKALAITRKASQVYYQPLHLELARYFAHARHAGYQLPAELELWQNSPQLLPSEYFCNDLQDRKSGVDSPALTSLVPDHNGTPIFGRPVIQDETGDKQRDCRGNPKAQNESTESSEVSLQSAVAVNEAVRRWEMRSINHPKMSSPSKNHGHLGIGWAPSPTNT